MKSILPGDHEQLSAGVTADEQFSVVGKGEAYGTDTCAGTSVEICRLYEERITRLGGRRGGRLETGERYPIQANGRRHLRKKKLRQPMKTGTYLTTP